VCSDVDTYLHYYKHYYKHMLSVQKFSWEERSERYDTNLSVNENGLEYSIGENPEATDSQRMSSPSNEKNKARDGIRSSTRIEN
jgi:hypothetical protein